MNARERDESVRRRQVRRGDILQLRILRCRQVLGNCGRHYKLHLHVDVMPPPARRRHAGKYQATVGSAICDECEAGKRKPLAGIKTVTAKKGARAKKIICCCRCVSACHTQTHARPTAQTNKPRKHNIYMYACVVEIHTRTRTQGK
jgi:hypothetical protein